MTKILTPKNVLAMPLIETRSMPTLLEQRNNYLEEMDNILKKAKEETRALTDDENTQFNQAKDKVTQIDSTLQAEQTSQKLSNSQFKQTKKPSSEEQRALDEENFIKFVRGEERALTVADNGGIIPTIIANRIIEKVKEISPIYARATVYNVGGDLVFPLYDFTGITTAYVADLTDLTAANGNFTTIKLTNFIAGSLVVLSKSLMNRNDFDLVTFIVNSMAKSIADFLEDELLNGAGGTSGATGIFVDTNVTSVAAASETAIGAADLIDLQLAIPQVYQANACWIMHKDILKGLRKLENTAGDYLLTQDFTQGYGWTLLGKPVFVSENAPNTLTADKPVIAYGDMSGLYVKLAQNVEISVLNELYAISHGVGVVGYVELDSRVVEAQKIAILSTKASA